MGLILSSQVGAATQNNPANWGLDRIDQRSSVLDNKYEYTEDGTGVYIYVLDVQLDANHPEFGSRVVKKIASSVPLSCSNGGGCGSPGSTCPANGNDLVEAASHGTHVAAIAAGTTYGVAKNAFIVGVEVLAACGVEAIGSPDSVMAGLDDAYDDWVLRGKPPAVFNLSLGNGLNLAMNEKINFLLGQGISVVVSAGNNGQDACLFSPSSTGGVNGDTIVVGASDINNYVWQTCEQASNFGGCVDLYAPGANITSAVSYDNLSDSTSGTSQAAPHVTGRVALYLQSHPGALPADVKEAITSYSVTHDGVREVDGSERHKLLHSKDTYDTADISYEFMGCAASTAHYLIEWEADFGSYEEYYTAEYQIGSGQWQLINGISEQSYSLYVQGSQQFRVRVSYTANGIASPVKTTNWRMAASCGGFNF